MENDFPKRVVTLSALNHAVKICDQQIIDHEEDCQLYRMLVSSYKCFVLPLIFAVGREPL